MGVVPENSRGVTVGSAAGGDLTGTFPSPLIAALAVGTGDIADLAVTEDKLAENIVGTGKVKDGAVTGPKLGAGVAPLRLLFDSTLSGAGTIDTGAGGVAQTCDHLLILILARTAEAVALSKGNIRFNADAGTNYDWQVLQGNNATASATPLTGQTQAEFHLPGTPASANIFGGWAMFIPSYLQTTAHKTMIGFGGQADSTVANSLLQARAWRWRDTSAITRVLLTGAAGGNLLTGSRMTIYGLAVA